MPRITRISGSLAAVLVAYWAYALMAVPWIAPPAAPTPLGPPQPIGQGNVRNVLDIQMAEIKPLFRPDEWEVASDKTIVLESDRAKLLFQKYDTTQGGGKVVLTPCTIVFLSDSSIRESIILQAPQAILQFDHDLNLNQPREANLLGGQLLGKIVIHSDWKQPGPEDDLLIVTKNVQLSKQSISTPERVEFRWGPHYGSGQDMQIKLLPGKSGASAMDAAGIASFELRHIEQLHLELAAEKGTGPICRNGPEGAAHKLDLSPLPPASTPVDISCSGPFLFDVDRRVATFHDNVRVLKTNPGLEKGTGPICRNGPEGATHKLDLSPFSALKTNLASEPDQLACDLLSLWLVERPKNAAGLPEGRTAKTRGSLDLVPERLEAVGSPVVVTAPSGNATAHAKRIEYNLLTKSITLDGDEPVFLQQGPNEIYARSLFYQSAAEEGRLGQLAAQGPGWLRGQAPDRPGQQLEAVWRDQLRIQPRDQYKEISFTGGVELKSPGVGQLQAGKVVLWLSEVPLAEKKFDLQPHGLSASEEVRFNSSRLSGKLDELEVWFEQDANRSLAAASTRRLDGMGGMGGSPPIPSPIGSPIEPRNTTASDNSDVRRLPETAQQHFEVVGHRLRARVLYGTAEPALTDLTIEDNVQLLETQTSLPGKRPVLIRGNRLDVVKANAPDAVATIVGQPAHFEGDGLALTGSTIKVNCGTNHLTIDGPGRMDITATDDLEGKPLPAPCNLTVEWQRGMDFDGRTARFEQSVVASTPGMFSKGEMTQFRLNTAAMAVQLQKMIRFSEAKTQEQPQVEAIRCEGGVAMDSHTFDARQQLIAHDQMQVTDLGINKIGGGLTGGPGWINTVRFGSADLLPGQPNAANSPAKPDQLYCLHVKFEKSMTGNILFQQVTFRDHVLATFAPVDSWDAMLTTNDPSRLGPKGAVATCDELFVKEMLLPVGDRRAIELYMLGNAKVEGAEYTALANRITYAQVKDILTLEGDGRAPAELLLQKQVGAPAKRVTGQKFRYFLGTKDIEGDGVQTMEATLPAGNGKK